MPAKPVQWTVESTGGRRSERGTRNRHPAARGAAGELRQGHRALGGDHRRQPAPGRDHYTCGEQAREAIAGLALDWVIDPWPGELGRGGPNCSRHAAGRRATPPALLHGGGRRGYGVRLTEAGTVLLEESRTLLSLLDRGLSRTRQAAGLGRPRLRFVVPPYLPETLAVQTAPRLRSAAAAAGVEVAWMETVLDAEFSAIRQRRADAGLGWLTFPREAMPAPLEVMELGEFEPDVWIPSPDQAAGQAISLDELAHMDVIHGPRRVSPATYDTWMAVL